MNQLFKANPGLEVLDLTGSSATPEAFRGLSAFTGLTALYWDQRNTEKTRALYPVLMFFNGEKV